MVGIYGGTFNPVHYGHLRTALEVKALFNLEDMRLVPSSLPPHREDPQVSGEMRLAMLRLAVANTPELQVDRRELDRHGPSYTVDTLESLKNELGEQCKLLLFMGVDAFAGIQNWYQYRKLFDYANIVVMTRPGFSLQQLPDFFQSRLVKDRVELQAGSQGCLYFQVVTQLEISATKIRHMIAVGENPQFLLPDKVLAFIREHKLYLSSPLTTGL